MRFADLRSGGRELAGRLENFRGDGSVIVLGVASGGVPVAAEVARHLGLPLDLVLSQTLLMRGPGNPVAVVSAGGNLILDEDIKRRAAEPASPRDFNIADSLRRFQERLRSCRGEIAPVDLSGKRILLIDDGIRSGMTMRIAIEAVRSLAPARITAAVPVGASAARSYLGGLVDELIGLEWPETFGHVGMFYKRFDVPAEQEIRRILHESRSSAQ